MSGGWQDEDVDGWKDGERMGGWMIGWMHRGVGRWMDECMDIAFWGTFVDRMGALERAQINIHDHWLRMLIFEGLPTTLGGQVDR